MLLDVYGYADRNGDGWREQPDGGLFLGIAYSPDREAVMREAKNLLVAHMPFKAHLHKMLPVLVQPWTRGYWRHPFMRDTFRFVATE